MIEGLFRFMHDCDSSKAVRDNFQHWKVCNTVLKTLGALNNLLNTKFKNDTNVKNHIAHVELHLSYLAAMTPTFQVPLKVTMIFSWICHNRKLAAIIASIITIKEGMATWDYVANIRIEENK